jgi:hypothetical protein
MTESFECLVSHLRYCIVLYIESGVTSLLCVTYAALPVIHKDKKNVSQLQKTLSLSKIEMRHI